MVGGTWPAASHSLALVDEQRGVAAVVEDHVRALAAGPGEDLLGAPPVLLERLALPGEDRDALRVLGGAVGPTTTAAAASSWVEKMLQEAQRTSAPSAVSVSMSTAVCTVMCSEPAMRAPVSGWLSPNSLAQGHQAGHLVLGEADLVAAGLGEAQVGNLVVKGHAKTPVAAVSVSTRRRPSGHSRAGHHPRRQPPSLAGLPRRRDRSRRPAHRADASAAVCGRAASPRRRSMSGSR